MECEVSKFFTADAISSKKMPGFLLDKTFILAIRPLHASGTSGIIGFFVKK
jgi:hypothetical protein